MKGARRLFSALLALVLVCGAARFPADAADSGYEIAVLTAQTLTAGTKFDPDTAPEAENVKAGDIVVLTLGFRNDSGAAVNVAGFAAKLRYNKEQVTPYQGTAPFSRNPYQFNAELLTDYGWSQAGNGDGDGFVSASAGGSDAYAVESGATLVLCRMAFQVNADASGGAATFTLDPDAAKTNVIDETRQSLSLDAFQPFAFTIDAPDNPAEPDTPDNPTAPDTPDNPAQPDNPDNPTEPDTPDNPTDPDTPDNPAQPDDPDAPAQPDNPEEPDTPDNPTDPDAPQGFSVQILRAQTLTAGTKFDPDTAPDAESVKAGDIAVLTLAFRNDSGAAVDVAGFAVRLLYDRTKVTPYARTAPFARQSYQVSKELAGKYIWAQVRNGTRQSFIALSASASNAHSVASGEAAVLCRMAFQVKADAYDGAATFTLDPDTTKTSVTNAQRQKLTLNASQPFNLTIDAGGNAPEDNPDTPTPPDNPDNPAPPDNPDNPAPPDNPDNPPPPDNPDNPPPPDNPDNPAPPDNPDSPPPPDNPDSPPQPDNPDNFTESDTPGNPTELEALEDFSVQVLKAQTLTAGTKFDPNTAPDAANVKAGDIVVLTLGFRNDSGAAVDVAGFAVKLLYDKAKVTPYTGTTPFSRNPYQFNAELSNDYVWSQVGNGNGDGFVSVSGGGSDAYAVESGATLVLCRMAFQVREDAPDGVAAFALSPDTTKTSVTDANRQTLKLNVLQAFHLIVGEGVDPVTYWIDAFALNQSPETLTVALTNPEAVTVAVAFFDADKMCLSVRIADAPAQCGHVEIPLPDASAAKIMLLDSDLKPLCPALDANIA